MHTKQLYVGIVLGLEAKIGHALYIPLSFNCFVCVCVCVCVCLFHVI